MSQSSAIVLEHGHFILRPFTQADVTARYLSWLNDKEITRFSELRHRATDQEGASAYVEAMTGAGNGFWAIEHHEFSHVGNIAIYFDRPNKSGDLSILLGERSVWGKGIAREAWRLVMEWALTKGDCRRVSAGTMAANTAMIRVMDRTGMTFDARHQKQFLLDNQPVDGVYYVRFANP